MFDQSDVDRFIEESMMMNTFHHHNVLGLVGVCIDAASAPYIVLPYMTHGSLLDHLRRERNRIVLGVDMEEEEVRDMERKSERQRGLSFHLTGHLDTARTIVHVCTDSQRNGVPSQAQVHPQRSCC